jgi:4-carboxymuconolactone decarboxylase
LVFDLVTELNESRSLSQRSFERGRTGLGLEPLIELVSGVGFYTMAALTLNAFDVRMP